MTKYLVKVTEILKTNENEKNVIYYGKEDNKATYALQSFAKNYGYKTEAQAKRNWYYKRETREPWLIRKAEIISIEL